MKKSKEYEGLCWWCGGKADSQEHKYKRTDIIREFGEGPYQKALLRIMGSKISSGEYVQGPKSSRLKYSLIMCSDCNNSKSQPFDLSYDKLMDFLKINEDLIYQTRTFDLYNVFGENWKEDTDNVMKYLIKHICCRLAESKIEITNDVINFLNGGEYPHLWKLHLIIESKKVEWIEQMKNDKGWCGILSLTPLTGTVNQENTHWEHLIGSYNYRAYTFAYSYCYAYSQFSCNLTSRIVKFDFLKT